MTSADNTLIALPNRQLVALHGANALPWLDKLVSQDLTPLQAAAGGRYTLFLSPQGKYVADFFVWRHGADVFLDIAKNLVTTVINTLQKYKLRADVGFTPLAQHAYYAPTLPAGLQGFADPRHESLGWRVWTAEALNQTAPLSDYVDLCLQHQVLSLDEVCSATDLPQEFGADTLHAISYSKGCFLGQELAARLHHRALIKHRIISVKALASLALQAEVQQGGQAVGRVVACGNHVAAVQVKRELFTADLPLQLAATNEVLEKY